MIYPRPSTGPSHAPFLRACEELRKRLGDPSVLAQPVLDSIRVTEKDCLW